MAGGEYIASHTITYEYIITDDPHHFSFPMERREFTRVIFLSSLAGFPSCYELFRFEFVSHFQIFKYI
jgi:hypothetical protein